MTPGSFDVDTCKEVLGDSVVRALEKRGRDAAEAGAEPKTPEQLDLGASWFSHVLFQMADIVVMEAYKKRKARLGRLTK